MGVGEDEHEDSAFPKYFFASALEPIDPLNPVEKFHEFGLVLFDCKQSAVRAAPCAQNLFDALSEVEEIAAREIYREFRIQPTNLSFFYGVPSAFTQYTCRRLDEDICVRIKAEKAEETGKAVYQAAEDHIVEYLYEKGTANAIVFDIVGLKDGTTVIAPKAIINYGLENKVFPETVADQFGVSMPSVMLNPNPAIVVNYVSNIFINPYFEAVQFGNPEEAAKILFELNVYAQRSPYFQELIELASTLRLMDPKIPFPSPKTLEKKVTSHLEVLARGHLRTP